MPVLVKFKAGRAFRRGDSKWVDAEEGRGLVYLEEEGNLLYFYYKNLSTNSTNEAQGGLDLLLFPGDASFSMIPGRRMAVLKFHSSSHRHFFWPQDVDSSRDAEIAETINTLIGGMESGEEADQMEGVREELPSVRETLPSSHIPPTASTSSMAEIQNIIASLGSARGSQRERQVSEAFTLPDVLPLSTLQSVLVDNPELAQILIPFLPAEVPHSEETLRVALTSPEFRRSLASLDRALRTGALGPLISGLGLPPEAADGVDSFLSAILQMAEQC